MMKKYCIIFFLILFAAGTVTAQTNIEIIKSDHPEQQLKKILVLSLLKDDDSRKTVENEISWWLNDKGFRAYSCNKLIQSPGIPTQKMIDDLVSQQGFDGILVSDLTDIKMKERYESNSRQNNYNPTTPTFYNFLDTYANTYQQGYNYNTKSYVINTHLYDKLTGQTLLEVKSSTYESLDLDRAIENYAKALSRVMVKSRILEKREKGKK